MKKIAGLIQRQEWAVAETHLSSLKTKDPFNPEVLFSLSYVLNAQGKVDAAINALRQCHGAAPKYVPAMLNLSVLLMQIGERKPAIHFAQMAIREKPNEANLHYHLSLLWKACRNSQYSLEAVDNALRIKPQTAMWMAHRMQLLTTLKRDQEAAAEAKRMLRIPEHSENLEALQTLNLFHASNSEWAAIVPHIDALKRAVSLPGAALNPTSVMMSMDFPDILLKLARTSAEAYPVRARPSRTWLAGKITIGYFTADVRDHPVAQMLLEVISRHNRENFEIVLIRLAPSDNSSIAQRIAALFDREIDIHDVPDHIAAQMIQTAGIDVIVDLMGLTQGHRMDLLAMRPCSTQILWLGCAVSTGCTHYDAFLVDSIVAPAGYENFCSEPFVRLPTCYHPISPGLYDRDSQLTREQLGLPNDGIVVGLLQQPNRIRPEFIEGVARLLARFPKVHFIMRVKKDAQSSALSQLTNWGMNAEQIHFILHFSKRSDYLHTMSLIDIALDSFPYGGHSTVGEALSLGTPVLTCTGNTIHSRVAASMMHQMGLFDLVTNSPEDQRAMLGQLLESPNLLSFWKNRFAIASRKPQEERHDKLVRGLEDAYAGILATAFEQSQ